MSTTSKVTLGASVVFTVSIISYVHLWQKKERERMRQGVVLDMERQKKKAENRRELEQQIKRTKVLEQQRQQADGEQR